jgi:hypothetical protein
MLPFTDSVSATSKSARDGKGSHDPGCETLEIGISYHNQELWKSGHPTLHTTQCLEFWTLLCLEQNNLIPIIVKGLFIDQMGLKKNSSRQDMQRVVIIFRKILDGVYAF